MIFENGNCIEGMKKLRSKSIDLIVADPPLINDDKRGI